MHLNTLAGRSYNDLMQYPVFPWIVADYDSEELDLYDEKTFRDLSKPMGAQTPGRLQQFKKRYQDWDDPQGIVKGELFSALQYMERLSFQKWKQMLFQGNIFGWRTCLVLLNSKKRLSV